MIHESKMRKTLVHRFICLMILFVATLVNSMVWANNLKHTELEEVVDLVEGNLAEAAQVHEFGVGPGAKFADAPDAEGSTCSSRSLACRQR